MNGWSWQSASDYLMIRWWICPQAFDFHSTLFTICITQKKKTGVQNLSNIYCGWLVSRAICDKITCKSHELKAAILFDDEQNEIYRHWSSRVKKEHINMMNPPELSNSSTRCTFGEKVLSLISWWWNVNDFNCCQTNVTELSLF